MRRCLQRIKEASFYTLESMESNSHKAHLATVMDFSTS